MVDDAKNVMLAIGDSMKAAIVTARALLGISGVALLLLGIAFWTGHALALIPLHMILGGVLMLSLWILVAISFYMRVALRLGIVVVVWSLAVALLGMTHAHLLPGYGHWVIQVLHLLIGIAAMGLGGVLATRLSSRATPRSR